MDGVHFCDSPEKLNICLTCTKKDCPHGTCSLVNDKVKGTYRGGAIVESEFRALYEQGYNDSDMACHFGVSRGAARRFRVRRGLEPNGKRGGKQC